MSAPIEDYDLVVLGTGEGAKFLAWNLAREGQRVAIVERKWIGGSCPNIACLPTKNVIHSAKVASYFGRAAEFGIRSAGFSVDMPAVRDRKRKMVSALVDIHVGNFEKSGTKLVMGEGRFVAPRTLEATPADGPARLLRGTNVVIGTGTRATIEPLPGLVEANPMTHIEALELDVVPDHLIVMGGGFVGLELAQALRRFGSRVTVIDRNERLASREDEDASTGLRILFEDEGIELVLGASVVSVSGQSGTKVEVVITQSGATRTVEGTHLLCAAGRTPNTADIGLELAGVKLNDRGYIVVDEGLRTSAGNTWAIGECAGSPQFTHIAFDDYRIIKANLAGEKRVTTGRHVPFCMFTDPEYARIGLSETEARAKGISYRLFKIPIAADLRTRTLSETRGYLKALVDGSDRILGFTAFGVDAGEFMGAVQLAMIGNLPYTAVRDAVLTHPTLLEGLVVLFSSKPTEPS